MGGIFQSLEIARKALWTSQAALNITSNNIANINTPGYSRQRAELSSSSPIDFGFGPIGTGVLINSVTRSRSALLDGNLRVSYTRSGYAQTEETMLTQLDSILREPGEGGLANIMNEFFNEWSNAANNPESSSSRDVLLQKGTNLANTFNRIYQQMNNQKAQVANESQSTVGQMNQVLEQLANLNKKINYSEVSGGQANDLRDKRDLLLDKLSEYGKVNFVESSQGMLNVSFEGVTLVSGSNFSALKSDIVTNAKGEKELQISIEKSSQTFAINTGKMGSIVNQYNNYLPDKMEKLDTLAGTLMNEVNKIHSASYGLPQGTPPSPSTGINFFSGDSASSMKINQRVLENPDNIAFSVSGEPGDTEAAITIANLANSQLMDGRSSTFSDYYSSFSTQIGLDIENIQMEVSQEGLIVAQLETQRDAYSGVNLDEEMINLTRFQRSYEAASKVVRTIDEMMQTIINLK